MQVPHNIIFNCTCRSPTLLLPNRDGIYVSSLETGQALVDLLPENMDVMTLLFLSLGHKKCTTSTLFSLFYVILSVIPTYHAVRKPASNGETHEEMNQRPKP